MALSIRKGPQARAIRTVIYGPEGIGKSTLASQFPGVVFVDFEHGTDSMDVARFDTPEDFDGVLTLLNIISQEDICKTVVLDTADKLEQLISRHVCLKYGISSIEDAGYGKGYTYLAEAWIELMKVCDNIIDSGKNIVFVAHAQMRKFEQPDEMGAYDRWELKLSKKTSPLLKEWSDMLLFCNYKTNVVTDEKTKSKKAVGGKRVMYSTHNPCWDAKNRFNFPDSMEMSFSEIASAFKAPADIKADTIAELRKMFQVAGIKEDDVMAYLKAKGQTDGSSLEELSLKILQFVKTNSEKIITKIKEE
jgi:hypothetical protein